MEEEIKSASKKNWIFKAALAAAILFVAVGGIIIVVMGIRGGDVSDIVLLADESAYVQYEIRNDSVLLKYNLTLRNDSAIDYSDCLIRGEFVNDYNSGFLLSCDANAREAVTGKEFFDFPAGESVSLTLVFYADYFRNSSSPSKLLPALTLVCNEQKIDVDTLGEH